MQEYALFSEFVTQYNTIGTSMEIYGQTTARNAILRQIAFMCPGCRRNCTTFVSLPLSASIVHWCGGIVCEIAGALSDTPAVAQPVVELKTPTGAPASLLRGFGYANTAIQLTRGTNADESLRLWCLVTSGDLVPAGLADVWMPSATAWRFRSMWDDDYASEINWPSGQKVVSWQPVRRVVGAAAAAAASHSPDAAYRCKRLRQRLHESATLLVLENAVRAAAGVDIEANIRRVFPALLHAQTPAATLARLVYYYQLNGTRMCKVAAAAFIDLFMSTRTAAIAKNRAPLLAEIPHSSDAHERCCCCSTQPSFLTTLSNRVCTTTTAAAMAAPSSDRHRTWPGSEFVGAATEIWQRKWSSSSTAGRPNARTRIQVRHPACCCCHSAQDLKVHIVNLNVSMTPIDATNVQLQTQGTRVLADLTNTPLPYAPLSLVLRDRQCATPCEVPARACPHAHTRCRNF